MKIGLVSYEFKNGEIEYNIKKNRKGNYLCYWESRFTLFWRNFFARL